MKIKSIDNILEKIPDFGYKPLHLCYYWSFFSGIGIVGFYKFFQQEDLENSLVSGAFTFISSVFTYSYYRKSKLNKDKYE